MKSISKRAPLRLDVSYAEKDHVPLILTTTATSPDSALVTSSCSGVCKLPAPSAFRAQSHRFEASLITEDVYLGSFTDAMQRAALVEHGITHILNVAKEVDSEHSSSDDDTHTPPSTSFVFKKIAVNDNSDEDIGKYFQECLEFIQAARDQHGKVLVHCRQGVSRSPTIVIAHLVHDLGYTLEDAMAHVQNCRESVCPNIGFILTLEEYADRSCRQDAVRLQGVSGQSLMRGCGGAPRGSVPSPSTVLMSPVPSCPHGVSMDAMTFSNAVLQC
eukprot:PhF_6_TR28354/c0_g1_i2/m.42051